MLAAEYDENEVRKQFTASERLALAEALEEEEKRRAKERMLSGKVVEPPDQLVLGSVKGQARASSPTLGTIQRGTFSRQTCTVAISPKPKRHWSRRGLRMPRKVDQVKTPQICVVSLKSKPQTS